jgi:hypothetical protein
MPEATNKWIEAVAKMIKLTQSGDLQWKVEPPPDEAKKQPDDRIEAVFSTDYLEKKLRIYKRTFKAYYPTVDIGVLLRGTSLEPYWDTEVLLEFLGPRNVVLWAFPKVDPLKDLLASVQYQVAGVTDFLGAILGEDPSQQS